MKRTYKSIVTAGLSLALAGSISNCLIVSDILGVDPVGGMPVETVVRQAAASSANGWMFGCDAALESQKDDLSGSAFAPTNCAFNQDGAEPFATYATAARNAANTMIPIAQDRSHAYYVASTVEACKSAAFLSAYLLTNLYLGSTVDVSGSNFIGKDDLATSTLIGVSGTGEACFAELVGTGRILGTSSL